MNHPTHPGHHRRTLAGITALIAAASTATAGVFTSTDPIIVPSVGTTGTGAPFPATLTVSGETTISSITVTLTGVTLRLDDLAIVLRSPAGRDVMLLGNSGGLNNNANITFTMSGPVNIFPGGPVQEGVPVFAYPVDRTGEVGEHGSLLNWNFSTLGDPTAPTTTTWQANNTFNSNPLQNPPDPYDPLFDVPNNQPNLNEYIGENPNGVWKLYIQDFVSGDSGSISTWSVNLNMAPVPEPATYATFGGLALAAFALLRHRRRA